MGNVYSPVFSQATGWVVGIIDNHTARPLSESEVKEACNALINGSAALATASDGLRNGERVCAELVAERDTARAELARITDERNAYRSALTEARNELDDARAEAERLRGECEEMQDEVAVQRERAEIAERRIEAEREEHLKLARLYTECELALHEVVPEGGDASHFKNAVESVVAHVKALRTERDATLVEVATWRIEHENAITCWRADLATIVQQRDAALAEIEALRPFVAMANGVLESRDEARREIATLHRLLADVHGAIRTQQARLAAEILDRIDAALAGKEH